MTSGYQGVHLPKMTTVNKVLIIALGGSFLLDSMLKAAGGVNLVALLGLSLNGILSGMVYQFVSYPFIGRGLIEVLFNGLILWFIGCELESLWGRKRYIQFLASSALGGGLVFVVLSFLIFGNQSVIALTGMAGMASALLLGYAILYPDRVFTFMLIFPMKAKYFCLLLVGIQLYMGFFSPAAALAWGHLGSMACGILYMVVVSRKKQGTTKRSLRRKSSHLSIVKDDDKTPKYWH